MRHSQKFSRFENLTRLRPSAGRLLASTALALAACGDSEGNGTDDSAPGTNPAVMVVAQAVTADDFLTYVAAFPDVPSGEVGLSRFREFGNANAYAFDGYVFIEQDGTLQRFTVNQELELIAGPRLSWQNYGIGTSNASYTVFASSSRAYTFAPDLGVLLVWNPDLMELTTTLPIELSRPADMETWAFDGHLVGNKVFWNVFSGNFDESTIYPATTVAIVDADADADTPLRFIEDTRCLPGGGSRVEANGDYYVQGGAYFGYFFAYGDAPDARTCLLRINAGQTEFDSSFLVDYAELLGSYVSDPWYHVSGDRYIVRSWDPQVPFPENPDEFYDNPALRPLFVDLATNDVRPYPDLQGKIGVDGVTREVDGVSYYQLSDTGYVEGGEAEIVELRDDGIVPRFRLDGFLLGLERLR